MKLADVFTITQKYINTNPKALRDARLGGHSKKVALDFKKFCEKNKQACHAYEGTFKLDNKKLVKHYWNIIGDEKISDKHDGETYNNKDGTLSTRVPYTLITDFAGPYSFVKTGQAEDLDRSRYTVEKEI